MRFHFLSQTIVYGDVYHCPSSSIVLSTPPLSPPRLRLFSIELTQAIMNCNKPLPALPKSYDLVENFNALNLAGRNPTGKKLPDPPGLVSQPDHESTFVGTLGPELPAFYAAPDSHRRPLAPRPLAVNRNGRTAAPPQAKVPPVPPSKQITIPIPMHAQVGKSTLTVQFALMSLGPDKPALAPLINVPPRPRSDSFVSPKAASKPPLNAAPGPTQPTLNVTPSRPRAVSGPSSPAKSSPGKTTAQCSGTTHAGKQCARRLKLPATHPHPDPTPVLFCHQHKARITGQTGFYPRGAGCADKFVTFSGMPTLEVKKGDGRLISFHFADYIPKYLQVNTQLALKVEMEKQISRADEPGHR